MTFPRAVLVLTGIAFLGFGLVFMLNPVGTIERVGIRVDLPQSIIEIRAMYGGLELGLGTFFLVASARERWIRAGLGAAMLSLGGLAIGRAVGMLAAGEADSLMLLLMVLETTGAILALVAFRAVRKLLLSNRIERRRLD